MATIYKTKVGKQGRIVLPRDIRDAFGVDPGDEVTIIVKERELTLRLQKAPEDPLEDLTKLADTVSIGLPAKKLKERADEERQRAFPKR